MSIDPSLCKASQTCLCLLQNKKYIKHFPVIYSVTLTPWKKLPYCDKNSAVSSLSPVEYLASHAGIFLVLFLCVSAAESQSKHTSPCVKVRHRARTLLRTSPCCLLLPYHKHTHTHTLHIHTFVLSGRCPLYSRGSTEGELENYFEHYLQSLVLYDFSSFLVPFLCGTAHFRVRWILAALLVMHCLWAEGGPIICSQTALRWMEQFLIFRNFS